MLLGMLPKGGKSPVSSHLFHSFVQGIQSLALEAPDNVVLVLAILVHFLHDTELGAEPARLRGGGYQRGEHGGHDHDPNLPSSGHCVLCFVAFWVLSGQILESLLAHTLSRSNPQGRERCNDAPGTEL